MYLLILFVVTPANTLIHNICISSFLTLLKCEDHRIIHRWIHLSHYNVMQKKKNITFHLKNWRSSSVLHCVRKTVQLCPLSCSVAPYEKKMLNSEFSSSLFNSQSIWGSFSLNPRKILAGHVSSRFRFIKARVDENRIDVSKNFTFFGGRVGRGRREKFDLSGEQARPSFPLRPRDFRPTPREPARI